MKYLFLDFPHTRSELLNAQILISDFFLLLIPEFCTWNWTGCRYHPGTIAI